MQSYLPLLMGIMASASSGTQGKHVSVSCPVHPEPSNGSGGHAVFSFYQISVYIFKLRNISVGLVECKCMCAPEINYLYILAIEL